MCFIKSCFFYFKAYEILLLIENLKSFAGQVKSFIIERRSPEFPVFRYHEIEYSHESTFSDRTLLDSVPLDRASLVQHDLWK